MTFTGAFSIICLIRTRSPWRASLENLSEDMRPIIRRAASRSAEISTAWVEKKSSVPATWPSRITGMAMAVLIPARRARGARLQSCSSPMSATWNRSRSRQARPLRPSPSRNRAVRVSRWNSSSTRPDSIEKTSAFSAGSTTQYDA